MASFEKDDLERIIVINEHLKYLTSRFDDIAETVEIMAQKHKKYDKKFWEIAKTLEGHTKEISKIEDGIEKSSLSYFFRNNWWKIGGAILSVATIFGAIGDYLYRLPPPVR